MCGRFTLRSSANAITETLNSDLNISGQIISPNYNITPSQKILVCRATRNLNRELVMMRWGLIPNWTRSTNLKFSMSNARSESISQKPAYRKAFRYRRCLIPADGFYEWQQLNFRKQPYFIRLRNKSVFSFAGIFEERIQEGGKSMLSCAIITTTANSTLQPIHWRMPVIIARDRYRAWLDPANDKLQQLLAFLQQYDSRLIEAYAVHDYVNNPRNNDYRCLQRRNEHYH